MASRHFVSRLERFLEPERSIAQLNPQAAGAQFPGQDQRGRVHPLAQRRDVGRCQLRRVLGLGLESQHQAIFAHGKPDSRRLGAADGLGKPVVAAAAEQRILCPQGPSETNSNVVRV